MAYLFLNTIVIAFGHVSACVVDKIVLTLRVPSTHLHLRSKSEALVH